METEHDNDLEEENEETLMCFIVLKGGTQLKAELPLIEIPSTKEELSLARNISPIVYWTGVILDWNEVSACVPDYSNV